MAIANGKVILLGEHAVVYGHPALVVGIAEGAEASVTIDGSSSITVGEHLARLGEGDLGRAFGALLHSLDTPPLCAKVSLRIPAGCGLGASAAVAVALARAALDLTDPAPVETAERRKRILRAADAWERVFHGSPSGIDAAAASRGGCFVFTRGTGPQSIQLVAQLNLAVAVADVPAVTRIQVEKVADLHETDPQRVDRIFNSVGKLVESAKASLEQGFAARLGPLMNENHALLQALSVSTKNLDRACDCARSAGALGAKLTGSGGGGCVVALCSTDTAPVLAAWKSLGLACFSTIIDIAPGTTP